MPVATPLITIMNMDRIPTPTDAGVGTATRLLTWLSPSFPVGGFS